MYCPLHSRVQDILFKSHHPLSNGKPKTESFKSGPFTLKVPVLAPYRADTLHKQAILAGTIRRIKHAQGYFRDKFDALSFRLEPICPDAELKVDAIAAQFEELILPTYTFSQFYVTEDNGTPLLPGNSSLSDDFKKKAIFFRFQITFNPRACTIPTGHNVNPTALPAPSSKQSSKSYATKQR